MSEKRKRDQREYLRGYKIKKKEEAKMIKREKLERYYMGKEDVKVLAATLAPISPHVALPSAPTSPSERLCSTIEDASALIVEQRYSIGETLLLEANTKERGYAYTRFLSFTLFLSIHVLVSFLGTKRKT